MISEQSIDYYVVHVFGFVLDASVGFLLCFDPTRKMAIMITTVFHLMNSQIFAIGMFPYVMIALTPIFCDHKWPSKIISHYKSDQNDYTESNKISLIGKHPNTGPCKFYLMRNMLIVVYMIIQILVPYSHFITKVS